MKKTFFVIFEISRMYSREYIARFHHFIMYNYTKITRSGDFVHSITILNSSLTVEKVNFK